MSLIKNSGKTRVPFAVLNKYMHNGKIPEFNFDTFKVAYDTDPKLQTIISNFDQNHIEFSRGSIDNLEKSADQRKSNISNLAKKAVDLKK